MTRCVADVGLRASQRTSGRCPRDRAPLEKSSSQFPIEGPRGGSVFSKLKNPAITSDARGVEAELQAVLITDAAQASSVVEKFRAKYGASDVKKYYSKFDVAVLAQMR